MALLQFPVTLVDRRACATQLRSLDLWYNRLDSSPGVGRLRQVRPLQGDPWLVACVTVAQQVQISHVTSVGT